MGRLCAAIIFAFATQVAADDVVVGKKLYTAKCASCHKLHDPSRYDDNK